MKRTISLCALLVLAQAAHADVYVLESDGLGAKHQAHAVVGNHVAGTPVNAHTAKPGEKVHGIPLGGVHPTATGSQGLIDSSGLKYFINTDITFDTTSSASGAMSEASYTHAVAATTMNGGVINSTLNDAFDGYNSMCISLSGVLGSCRTGNSSFVIYDHNGPATTECNGRQIVLPTQTIVATPPPPTGAGQTSGASPGVLSVSRKIYVPTDDTFARSMNIVTNISSAPVTFALDISNNLGSDNNTQITATSNGTLLPTSADKWIASFQAYSGTTSSDVRLGHVIQGTAPATPVAGFNFVNGDDNPWWGYTVTLSPGQTKIIVNFVTGQASNAAAAANAARLSALAATSLECLTPVEKTQITNFVAVVAPPVHVPSLSPMALIWLMLGLAVAGGFYTLRRRA